MYTFLTDAERVLERGTNDSDSIPSFVLTGHAHNALVKIRDANIAAGQCLLPQHMLCDFNPWSQPSIPPMPQTTAQMQETRQRYTNTRTIS